MRNPVESGLTITEFTEAIRDGRGLVAVWSLLRGPLGMNGAARRIVGQHGGVTVSV
jgi:hypothetical protein